jgi:undecaprenyl-diphosphatase
MMARIQSVIAQVREQGWWVLGAVLLIGGALNAFAELADEVEDGETHAFDRAVMLALRHPGDPADPLGPAWIEFIARDITALGGTAVLVLLTLAALGFLLLSRRWGAALFVALAMVGGTLLSNALKSVFDRPRPDLVPHAVEVSSASFPSGHAMLSAVAYLTLGALVAEVLPQRRFRIYLLLWAVFLTLVVGTSRVYLGVHWPTDVLAGWSIGAAWALLCASVAYWMQRRGVLAGAGAVTGADPRSAGSPPT